MTTHTTTVANATRTTREEKLDAARGVLNAGFDGLGRDPEALARFLAFRAHFHDYSLNNAVLIWCQRPTARHCMGYRAWQAHGRQVRKGERGLTILAPVTRKREETDQSSDGARAVVGYRTATVFDYEQTDAVADSALVYTPPAPRLNADDPDGLGRGAGGRGRGARLRRPARRDRLRRRTVQLRRAHHHGAGISLAG